MTTFIHYVPGQTVQATKQPPIKLTYMENVIEFQTDSGNSKDNPITLSDEAPAASASSHDGRTNAASLSRDPDSPSTGSVEGINQRAPASAGHVHDIFVELEKKFGKDKKKRAEDLTHKDAGPDVGEDLKDADLDVGGDLPVGTPTEVASDDLYAAYSTPGELDGASDEPAATSDPSERQGMKRNRELRRLRMDLVQTPLTKTRKEIRRARESEEKAAFASLHPRKRRCLTYAYSVKDIQDV